MCQYVHCIRLILTTPDQSFPLMSWPILAWAPGLFFPALINLSWLKLTSHNLCYLSWLSRADLLWLLRSDYLPWPEEPSWHILTGADLSGIWADLSWPEPSCSALIWSELSLSELTNHGLSCHLPSRSELTSFGPSWPVLSWAYLFRPTLTCLELS
jgi:hypothetical protein